MSDANSDNYDYDTLWCHEADMEDFDPASYQFWENYDSDTSDEGFPPSIDSDTVDIEDLYLGEQNKLPSNVDNPCTSSSNLIPKAGSDTNVMHLDIDLWRKHFKIQWLNVIKTRLDIVLLQTTEVIFGDRPKLRELYKNYFVAPQGYFDLFYIADSE